MTVNEFRVGNIVYYCGKPIVINVADIYDFDDEPDNYKPIPLTPEILGAAGFEKYINNMFMKSLATADRHLSISFYSTGIFPLLLQDSEFSNGEASSFNLNKIEYLHQLQNIYWWLCGEELEIDINKIK